MLGEACWEYRGIESMALGAQSTTPSNTTKYSRRVWGKRAYMDAGVVSDFC